MLDFPNSPTVGQVFGQWLWDGGKWGPTAGSAAPINSPSFTGDPKAPTPATGDNDTSIATTAFVKAQGYLLNNQVITLSGDIAGSGATAITTTLATVNSNVGTFQGLTLDAKGRVTAAVNQNYVTGGPYLPTAGGIIQSVGNTPLELIVPATGQCESRMTVASVRTWMHVIGNTGVYSVYDATAAAYRIQISTAGVCQNTSGSWSAISDRALKTNVADYTVGLSSIIQLRPVTFGWADENKGPEENWGLIAQEVEPVMPELVGEITDGIGDQATTVLTVDYTRAIFAVINSLKEVSARLDAIEARLPPIVQGS